MSKKKCDLNSAIKQPKIQLQNQQKNKSSTKKDRSQGVYINKQNMIKKWNQQVTQVYKIQKKLGEGSFGQVYLVQHKKLKVKRAMKVIEKFQRMNASSRDQLDVLKKLDHPNILKIYEYFESLDKWYIITEFFQGMELLEYIVARGKLTQKVTAIIFHEIIKSLAYVHANNIAHRDIKAENVLIKDIEGNIHVKVIDWGLGSLVGNQQMMRKCGTPQYCAPEVILGKYTLSCDMWSAGVLLYIMLSGYMPFKGSSVSQTLELSSKGFINLTTSIWKSVSQQAKSLIKKLLQKNTKKRLTAQQCLKDEWLLSHNQSQSTDFQQVQLKQTLIRIKQFNSESKFQIVVINFILNYIRQPDEEEKLRKQFEMLDQNKDGVLSFQELVKGYIKIYGPEGQRIAQQIFLSLDLDGSGKIEYSEFVTFASNMNRKFNIDELKHAFKLFDQDQDGLIDMKQINQLLLYQKDSQQEQFSQIVEEIDLNKDGKIDFNQFVSHINNAINKVKLKLNSSKSLSLKQNVTTQDKKIEKSSTKQEE